MTTAFTSIKESDMNFKPTICVAMLMAFANPVMANESILTAPKNPDESQPQGEEIITAYDKYDGMTRSEIIEEMLKITDGMIERNGYINGLLDSIEIDLQASIDRQEQALGKLEVIKNG